MGRRRRRERRGFAEMLLALLIFPFILALKIAWFVVKMIVRSVILAPLTIVLWIGVLVALILIFM